MKKKSLAELTAIISDEHQRQRIAPRHDDALYLHLSDLLLALQAHATDAKIDILDFGAGSSPYRPLFPNANYKRADFPIGNGDGLNFVLGASLEVPAPDNSFDFILSTQVLEHVVEPEIYLLECLRLLRPGGKLVLTTHGIYGDHPCPFDLHRWTADGLAALCKKSGFSTAIAVKLTTDARALLFLYDTYGRRLHRRQFTFFSVLFALYYRFHCCFRGAIHRWADWFFPDSRVAKNGGQGNDIYINLLVHATKTPGA
jgi:SAM-dependent methyltransferase